MSRSWLMPYDPRGSLWRRWDLHFHTRASFDYRDASIGPERLVAYLKAQGLSVVAVTDHHFIDVPAFREMQRVAGDELTLLPGLELRSELGGGESVHYIGIFPEDSDLEDIWTKLQSLKVSPADVATIGNDRIYVPFVAGATRIRDLGGLVTVHAGRKTNSIENISNADEFKQAVKADLAKEHIDILDVASLRDADEYRTIVFPYIGHHLPLVISSDNHDAKAYATRIPFWVRADPGFRGLIQLINEPDGRGFLGDEPPLLARVRQRTTKIIESVRFAGTQRRTPDQEWFAGAIPFNPGMVAIIGSKGGGKSALTDTVGLLGNSRSEADFSFLSAERFLEPKSNLGRMFEATITWQSGAEATSTLGAGVNETLPELVKYIPQSYLERICTEFGTSTDSTFDRELRAVIYSHVPPADRLEKPTVSELIEYLTEETQGRIEGTLEALRQLNIEIVRLEDMTAPEFRAQLEAMLTQKQTEIEAHREAEPPAVLAPDQDAEAKEAARGVVERIQALREEISALDDQVAQTATAARSAAARIASADRLLTRLAGLQRQFDVFQAESADDAAVLEIAIETVATLTVDRLPIETIRASSAATRQVAAEALDAGREGSVAHQLGEKRTALEAATNELDGPSRRFEAYQEETAAWGTRLAQLIGPIEDPESEAGLTARLGALDGVPDRLTAAYERRRIQVADVFEAKLSLLAEYRRLFAPVQVFIETHPIAREQQALQFDASIVPNHRISELLDLVHQGKKGSFAGDAEGRDRLTSLVAEADFSNVDGVVAFVSTLADQLWTDHREMPPRPMRLRDQLRQGVEPTQIYDLIFGLEHLEPRFELTWNGRNLDQLSPGERGSLLLVFYLLIDLRDEPLMIDQPEENLDNETITALLIPAVKAARERRQIIMVTHSPNLAVVCDADQVIHARIDRTGGNRITYTTGSIENPEITPHVVDVLEGTMPAFMNRGAKYDALLVQT